MASNKQTESCLYGDSKSGYSPALIFPLSAIDRAKSDRAARRKLLLGKGTTGARASTLSSPSPPRRSPRPEALARVGRLWRSVHDKLHVVLLHDRHDRRLELCTLVKLALLLLLPPCQAPRVGTSLKPLLCIPPTSCCSFWVSSSFSSSFSSSHPIACPPASLNKFSLRLRALSRI
jgi:hypothetical protein